MAETKELRIAIAEEDTTVIGAICTALNSLSNPKERNGFNFKFKEGKLFVSVFRARLSFPSFEVSFKTTSDDESVLLEFNSLFRECILKFEYDSKSKEFVVSLQDTYETCEYALANQIYNEEMVISLKQPFQELSPIVDLLNIVKIIKVLTIDNNVLSISAVGKNISILVRFSVVRQLESLKLPSFCSKFNFLSALELATFKFAVTELKSKTLLHVSILPPKDNDSRYKKYCETLDLFNSISSFVPNE